MDGITVEEMCRHERDKRGWVPSFSPGPLRKRITRDTQSTHNNWKVGDKRPTEVAVSVATNCHHHSDQKDDKRSANGRTEGSLANGHARSHNAKKRDHQR